MSIKDDLQQPGAYPDLRPAKVELAETHVSWVFVLERDVFKVKRPVSLGFVDFRTLEQRKTACEAEIALNARLSPEAYRGIVPVRRSGDGRATFGGDGPIVDYAVHMVRQPEDRRGDVLLARGQLGKKALDRIAERMAEFHTAARCDDETSRFGAPAVIEGNIEENFAQTEGAVERYLSPAEAGELVRWQKRFVAEHHALFAERIAGRRIRDGHGDLRLDQLYVHPGDRDLTVLDCIEFNERFRFADVCADIAFLSMDLAAHRRVDLAERLLASYARASNDFDLYALADFYESYRAYVRAKIAVMQAEDVDLEAPARERAAEQARRYFLLALAESTERRSLLRPVFVAVGGIIASGKSTVAERIGDLLSAPVIDADRTRKAMLGVAATAPVHEGAWHGAYDPAFTEKVYAEALRRAGAVLASGRPVVLDASFRSASMRARAREAATGHGVPFRFALCRADPDVCRARLAEREQRPGVSDGRLAIFDDFCSRFEPVTEVAPDELVVLDTARPLAETERALRQTLEAWPEGLRA